MSRRSFAARWEAAVAGELEAQGRGPGPVLTDDDLAKLPGPVQRYVRASGAVGRPVPTSMRLEMDAVMHRAPGDRGMRATSIQWNWFGHPARMFLMQSRMFGLPVKALHLYRDAQATFQVRAAGLLTMVDQAGDVISRGETVTVLNDMCAFAPGTLADPRLSWTPVDDRTAAVAFANGPYEVTASLVFNDDDELVDFWSDDRPESVDGGLVSRRWSTPLSGYLEIGRMRLATQGSAVYARPDGPFTYGAFAVRSVAYDVARI
jgi:hypothetical protein